MIWRIVLAAWLTLLLAVLGLQAPSRAQFNGCSAGFCNKSVTSSIAATIWNSGALGSGLALSGGNLTATYTGGAGPNAGKSNNSHASGKFYFEVTTNFGQSNSREFGIGNAAAGTTGYQIGVNDANSIGWGLGGGIFQNSASLGTVDACGGVTGICAIAVDLTNNLIWTLSDNGLLRWNASGAANPATGTGGLTFSPVGPYFVMFSTNTTGDSYVGNFGASTYGYATIAATLAASGFGNW